MESIIVGFSRPKKWKPFAWLIMKFYSIPYDHVYIKFFSEAYQRPIVYQASNLMVNFMGTEVFQSENQIIDEFEVPISVESKLQLIQFAIDNAGKPYGLKEALGLGIVRIAQLLGFSIKNPFSDGHTTYVCSELAGYILKQYAGAALPNDIDDISPLEVHTYLSKVKSV